MKLVFSKGILIGTVATAVAIPVIATAIVTPLALANRKEESTNHKRDFKPNAALADKLKYEDFQILNKNILKYMKKIDPQVVAASVKLEGYDLRVFMQLKLTVLNENQQRNTVTNDSVKQIAWSLDAKDLTADDLPGTHGPQDEIFCDKELEDEDAPFKYYVKTERSYGDLPKITKMCFHKLHNELYAIYSMK